MLIELSKLDDGRGKFENVYHQAELDLAEERVRLAGDVFVSGKVRRSGAGFALEGKIETVVEVECDRCLRAVRMPLKTGFSLEYLSKDDYEASQAVELTEEDLAVSIFEDDTIDVDEIVREQILLFVPARTLCVENCKGICSTCGADLNAGDCGCVTNEVDPRWEALKNLRITD